MIIHNFEQRSDEWRKVRLGKFGSTDAQAVASNGKGLETACFQKVAEILIGEPPELIENEHILRGIELEGMARSSYEISTGGLVTEVGYVEMNNYAGCSPDGLVGDKGLVEIKCPSNHIFVREIYEGKVPSNYMWQMQYQMFICEREWCDYVIFNSVLDKTHITRVERDEKKIEKIKEGLEIGIKKIEEILGKIA